MARQLIDHRARDGSRQFATFAPARSWRGLRATVEALPGVSDLRLMTDAIDEVWFDFRYAGHGFTLHESLGSLRCFVDDPAAPDALLDEVAALCARHSEARTS